ncbi:MAG: glycine/sarcosine/betaine reductase selenoprotein B family protein [Thermodesulfobacteriota bacterium]
MQPINYVSCLDNMYQSQGFPAYRWSKFDSSPWTLFDKPLDQARIALISSAGIFKDDQAPFDPWAVNDLSYREIPIETPFEQLQLHHNYFDHRDAVTDLNCVFPVHRLQELAQSEFIGSVAPQAITLGMGRLYKRTALQEQTTPELIELIRKQNADAVLLVAA